MVILSYAAAAAAAGWCVRRRHAVGVNKRGVGVKRRTKEGGGAK